LPAVKGLVSYKSLQGDIIRNNLNWIGCTSELRPLLLEGLDNSHQLLVVYGVIALRWGYFLGDERDRLKDAVRLDLGQHRGGDCV
jgi:hypothetical protein